MNAIKRIKKALKNQKGFTVIETILTATIISMGLLGGMMVLENAVANSVYGDLNSIATQRANEKLEQVLADKQFLGYEYITESNYPSESLTSPYQLTRTITITEVNSEDLITEEEGSGLKKVEVAVSWGDGSDVNQSSVSTLVADY